MNTVCRYGELYNEAPKCPWNACKNADCSICKDGWEDPDQGLAVALASLANETHPQEETSNSKIYAGAAFGVIGAIAAGALIARCNKKRTNPNQEPLTWTRNPLSQPLSGEALATTDEESEDEDLDIPLPPGTE